MLASYLGTTGEKAVQYTLDQTGNIVPFVYNNAVNPALGFLGLSPSGPIPYITPGKANIPYTPQGQTIATPISNLIGQYGTASQQGSNPIINVGTNASFPYNYAAGPIVADVNGATSRLNGPLASYAQGAGRTINQYGNPSAHLTPGQKEAAFVTLLLAATAAPELVQGPVYLDAAANAFRQFGREGLESALPFGRFASPGLQTAGFSNAINLAQGNGLLTPSQDIGAFAFGAGIPLGLGIGENTAGLASPYIRKSIAGLNDALNSIKLDQNGLIYRAGQGFQSIPQTLYDYYGLSRVSPALRDIFERSGLTSLPGNIQAGVESLPSTISEYYGLPDNQLYQKLKEGAQSASPGLQDFANQYFGQAGRNLYEASSPYLGQAIQYGQAGASGLNDFANSYFGRAGQNIVNFASPLGTQGRILAQSIPSALDQFGNAYFGQAGRNLYKTINPQVVKGFEALFRADDAAQRIPGQLYDFANQYFGQAGRNAYAAGLPYGRQIYGGLQSVSPGLQRFGNAYLGQAGRNLYGAAYPAAVQVAEALGQVSPGLSEFGNAYLGTAGRNIAAGLGPYSLPVYEGLSDFAKNYLGQAGRNLYGAALPYATQGRELAGSIIPSFDEFGNAYVGAAGRNIEPYARTAYNNISDVYKAAAGLPQNLQDALGISYTKPYFGAQMSLPHWRMRELQDSLETRSNL